jgi:hypothetical protein
MFALSVGLRLASESLRHAAHDRHTGCSVALGDKEAVVGVFVSQHKIKAKISLLSLRSNGNNLILPVFYFLIGQYLK